MSNFPAAELLEQRVLLSADFPAVALEEPPPAETAAPIVVIGGRAASRGDPQVYVYRAGTGEELFALTPYPGQRKLAVRVAVGDVNGDGVADIITAGTGRLPVQVFDGATGERMDTPQGALRPFGPRYRGEMFIASADFNGDDFSDIVIGGVNRVVVIDGQTGEPIAGPIGDFVPFEGRGRGAVTVAAGLISSDDVPDILVGSAPRMPSLVNVFSGETGVRVASLNPFADVPAKRPYAGGLNVATGDITGGGLDEIITSPRGKLPSQRVAGFGFIFDTKVKIWPEHLRIYRWNLQPLEMAIKQPIAGISFSAVDWNGNGQAQLVLVSPGRRLYVDRSTGPMVLIVPRRMIDFLHVGDPDHLDAHWLLPLAPPFFAASGGAWPA
jgi:hypothetical protein